MPLPNLNEPQWRIVESGTWDDWFCDGTSHYVVSGGERGVREPRVLRAGPMTCDCETRNALMAHVALPQTPR